MNKLISIIFIILSCVLTLFAQEGIGSMSLSNGKINLSPNQFKTIYAETLYIGEKAEWIIDGQIDLYVKNIWIAPTAKITGSGVLIIHNPGHNPFYDQWKSQPTNIDGNNGNFVDVKIVLQNDRGLRLKDIAAHGERVLTFSNKSKNAALRLAKDIDLAADGANVLLDGADLELGQNAMVLNYSYRRFVITNMASSGHLIKNFAKRNEAFLFPVGKQVGDFTPARLIPSAGKSKVYVSVTDYLASGLNFNDEQIGMDRIWNIFAEKSMLMNYTLMHNVSSNGLAYIDPSAQIMQNADGGNWIGDVTQYKSVDKSAIHTRKDVIVRTPTTRSGTWFTKFSSNPPVAENDYAVLAIGKDKVINVLENDRPGGAAILTNSVEIVEQPKNIMVSVKGGALICSSSSDFLGIDELEYRITDQNGLTATAKVIIKVVPRDLFIPNVFSPNGDGKNDNYVISGMEAYDRVELIIVDRFGVELFRSDSYGNEWIGDGLKEGTYYYNVTTFRDGESKLYKGSVLIKRK